MRQRKRARETERDRERDRDKGEMLMYLEKHDFPRENALNFGNVETAARSPK